MSEPRRRWVARMPTHAELESDDFHPAEELPQGPIPTGPEFRVMRLIRGFSLRDMADRVRRPVHWVAAIEGRRVPLADLDELVLHTVLRKCGVRWFPDLLEVASAAWHDSDLHDWAQLLDHTGSEDLADLDDMAGPRVQVTRADDAVLVVGSAARVQMLFPLDIEEFWDVVEDVAAAGPRT
ncbi:hypothetical protein SAMN05660199_03190 [Klenkia soli]|uniref:Helix-turn-helix domain-containing protein n=1 Tax=Klenkia soli TaxID=1052260 RepID=A0A1H0Q2G2_9ACTN|nr:hypothetical protein [Klenkia soli]SDP11602.1 hypothetical protein SAMN05660199_03190 [Klenkia soli]